MSKGKIREDKTCLNCNYVVENRFCPNCGQENKETKESFHYLFTHTIEDIVHYDSGFWKTIKYLLFYPAKLTKEYTSGRRQTFVAPVKLYIFISFITFFIMSVIPDTDEKSNFLNFGNPKKDIVVNNNKSKNQLSSQSLEDVKKYDSIQKTLPLEKRDTEVERWSVKTSSSIVQKLRSENFVEKFNESIIHNLPKGLFILMPLFALVLWLFHNKKKWYYFDHGIFTLHYFSMLLLSLTLYSLLYYILELVGEASIINLLQDLITFTMFFWWVFYFYRSHSRFYQESKLVSRVKASIILTINFAFTAVILLLLILYSVLNVK